MARPRKRLTTPQYLGPERRKTQVGMKVLKRVFIVKPADFFRINFAQQPGTYIITLKTGQCRTLCVYKNGKARISKPGNNPLQTPTKTISVEKFLSDPKKTAKIEDIAYNTQRTKSTRPSEN